MDDCSLCGDGSDPAVLCDCCQADADHEAALAAVEETEVPHVFAVGKVYDFGLSVPVVAAKTEREFRVALVSLNYNAFGLKNHIFVAPDGEAWQAAANDLNGRKVGDSIHCPGHRNFGNVLTSCGFEIPQQLPDCPAAAVATLF